MATYTPLTLADAEKITGSYDLGPILGLESMGGGQANSSFIVTTQAGTYVLSVCDEKSPAEVSVLTATLDHLSSHDYLSSGLVKTMDGNRCTEFDSKPVYVKEYMVGRVEDPLSPDMVCQVGVALANLHAIPVPDGLPETFAYGIETFAEIFNRSAPFPDWLKSHMARLESGCSPELPKGLIHGDLFYDNMLFADGTLSAILDFEEACHYYLLFDLGMCSAGSCCLDGTFSMELAAALVHGYQSVRQLTPLEWDLFQNHIIYGAAATAFWRYRQYNIIYPDIGKEDNYVEMMELADQVEAIPSETFKKALQND
jgi:homoserine kinase type II